MKARLIPLAAMVTLLLTDRPCFSQLDVLNRLFGGKGIAKPQQGFSGHQALQQAVTAAEAGEEEQSFELVTQAFQDGGIRNSLEHPETRVISANLFRLVKAWESHHANPKRVASVLMNVVVPPSLPGEINVYPDQWAASADVFRLARPGSRLAMPDSIGAHLVYWTIIAKQNDELKQRLHEVQAKSEPRDVPNVAPEKEAVPKEANPKAPVRKAVPPKTAAAAVDSTAANAALARVLELQLAMAEKDIAAATALLLRLKDDAAVVVGATLEHLCHAVSAGMADNKTAPVALGLLEVTLDRIESTSIPGQGLRMNAPWLRVQTGAQYARLGRHDEARRIASAAVSNPMNDTRYGADYGSYLNHVLRLQAAVVLLDSGHLIEGLDLLNQPVAPNALRYLGRDTFANVAAKVGRALKELPAEKRWEFLRKFSLAETTPTEVRSLVDLVPYEAFPTLGSGILFDIYSTDWDLVATARDVGKLDDLIGELSAIESPSPSISSLLTLALVMRDGSAYQSKSRSPRDSGGTQTAARLRRLLEDTTAAVPPWELQNKPEPPLSTYVIAAEAALHPEWREVAEQLMMQLIEHAQKTQSARIRDHFRLALMEVKRLRTSGSGVSYIAGLPQQRSADPAVGARHDDWLRLRPELWDALGFDSIQERSLGSMPPTWFAYEGYVSHLSTGRESDLCFAVPLTGTFELTAESREGGWTEGRVGYGGVAAGSFAYSNVVNLAATGNQGGDASPKMTNLLHREPWNRYTIRVDKGQAQFYVNGQLVLDDQPGVSAPWISVAGTVGFTPSYRNFRIEGNPSIPERVDLVTDTRLRGWNTICFGETRPETLRQRKYLQVELEQNGQKFVTIREDDGTVEGEPAQVGFAANDWEFTDGELRSSRRGNFWPEASPSWLSYQRPLREKETLTYEFYYEAGKTIAHPTFGEVVYTLAENLTEASPVQSGLDASLAGRLVTRSAKGGLPVEGWNSLSVSLREGTLQIQLNGKPIVVEKVSPANSRRFGFYHDAAIHDLRVRNVVLSGDWPKEFDAVVRSLLESPRPVDPLPKSQFLAQTASLNEAHVSDNAYEIARRSLVMDADARYQYLHRWVMPNESHDVLRMAGAFTPTHPSPPVLSQNPIDVATTEARQAVDQRRIQTGGNFVCPAILLVLTAAELDRLGDLKQELTGLAGDDSIALQRNRAAMLAMIALFDDMPEEAFSYMAESFTLLSKNPDVPIYERWCDTVIASLAIQHPHTRRLSYEILDRMMWLRLQSNFSISPELDRFIRQLEGQCLYLMYGGSPEEFGTQPKTTQWQAVSIPRARSRGTGYPVASFDVIAGEMAERGGHDLDAAYFRSPLRGNYEVRCRLSHIDHRESLLTAAGIASTLKWSHKEVKVTRLGLGIQELPLDKPITPEVRQWLDYKVTVKDGRYTSYVNGQKLYEESLPPDHDPWLSIGGWPDNLSHAVRDLVITGSPQIPAELDLLGPTDLRGWLVNYYASEWQEKPFAWVLDEGELKSPLVVDYYSNRAKLKVQNIIRYHRPMLEDGVMTYEFFYDPTARFEAPPENRFGASAKPIGRRVPGQTMVHPALDRMVFLLQPDGVKLHWLTDGRWDRTGLMADNVDMTRPVDGRPAGSKGPIPLKVEAWNALKLSVTGDQLTIELNGEVVATCAIDPTNLRQFGLFHYADESNVRVRNIHYRGDWPKALPAPSEQDLAGQPQKLAVIPDDDLPESRSWDFTQSRFSQEEFQFHWNAEAGKRIKPTEQGLKFVQPAGEMKAQEAGLAPKIRISGNFVATMEYEGLKTVPAVEIWGCGLSFKAITDGGYDTGFEVREAQKSLLKTTRAIYGVYLPNCPWAFRTEAIPDFPQAARLRMQRRGSVHYTFLAEPGSDKFKLLTQRPLGTDDIKKLVVVADASDRAAGSEFILKSLSVRAAKITNTK